MTTTGIQIRKANSQDAKALRQFAEFTFRHAYEANNDKENMDAYCFHAFTLPVFEQELADENINYYVACQHEELIGFIKTLPSYPPFEIAFKNPLQLCRIYVHPNLKGQGIGAMLVATAVSIALQHHNDLLWLGVWQTNEPAIAFYKKMGFKIIGTEIFVLGTDPQLDWVMSMPILK